MKLKAFEYNYSIRYGSGCGIVFAETKEEAIKMINEKPYAMVRDLEVEEIDISKPRIFDHSWQE
jgi:hypothetical protein